MNSIIALLDKIPHSVLALLARIAIWKVFWDAGRSKVSGFLEISGSTFLLFEHEYTVPLLPSNIAAYLATYSEHVFSVLIILGLFTRFAALALLGMTMVIQVFVYPEAWGVHIMWAALLAFLAARGPGMFSLDHVLFGRR